MITLGGCSSESTRSSGASLTRREAGKSCLKNTSLQVVKQGLCGDPTDPTCFKDSGGGFALQGVLQVDFLVLLRLTRL